MNFATGFGGAGRAALAAALLLAPALAAPALAGSSRIWPGDEIKDDGAVPVPNGDVLEGIDVDKLDWSQLAADASTLKDEIAARKKQAAKVAASSGPNWSSTPGANGQAAVTVKQSLSPFWDTRIGADMTVAPDPTPTTMSEFLAEKVANGGSVPQSSSSAWAAATAPGAGAIWDKTAVEARLDPGAENSKLGATLSKSVPLAGDYSLTLQNGYDVVQQGTTALPGIAARTTRSYETGQSAKVTIAQTGTSFVAGQTLSTLDDRWLRNFGAEQKLFDVVTISASVGETDQGTTNKSLTAGFKTSW